MADDATQPSTPTSASAVSGHFDTRTAGMEVANLLHESLGEGCDLVLFFASFHHLAAFSEAQKHGGRLPPSRHSVNGVGWHYRAISAVADQKTPVFRGFKTGKWPNFSDLAAEPPKSG